MGKLISGEALSDTLRLSNQTDGFWLWDTTRQMNLAIKVKSEREALVQALHYYQNRLQTVEGEHRALSSKVDSFLS